MPVTSTFTAHEIAPGNVIELFDPRYGCAVSVRVTRWSLCDSMLHGTVIAGVHKNQPERCTIAYDTVLEVYHVAVIDDQPDHWADMAHGQTSRWVSA